MANKPELSIKVNVDPQIDAAKLKTDIETQAEQIKNLPKVKIDVDVTDFHKSLSDQLKTELKEANNKMSYYLQNLTQNSERLNEVINNLFADTDFSKKIVEQFNQVNAAFEQTKTILAGSNNILDSIFSKTSLSKADDFRSLMREMSEDISSLYDPDLSTDDFNKKLASMAEKASELNNVMSGIVNLKGKTDLLKNLGFDKKSFDTFAMNFSSFSEQLKEITSAKDLDPSGIKEFLSDMGGDAESALQSLNDVSDDFEELLEKIQNTFSNNKLNKISIKTDLDTSGGFDKERISEIARAYIDVLSILVSQQNSLNEAKRQTLTLEDQLLAKTKSVGEAMGREVSALRSLFSELAKSDLGKQIPILSEYMQNKAETEAAQKIDGAKSLNFTASAEKAQAYETALKGIKTYIDYLGNANTFSAFNSNLETNARTFINANEYVKDYVKSLKKVSEETQKAKLPQRKATGIDASNIDFFDKKVSSLAEKLESLNTDTFPVIYKSINDSYGHIFDPAIDNVQAYIDKLTELPQATLNKAGARTQSTKRTESIDSSNLKNYAALLNGIQTGISDMKTSVIPDFDKVLDENGQKLLQIGTTLKNNINTLKTGVKLISQIEKDTDSTSTKKSPSEKSKNNLQVPTSPITIKTSEVVIEGDPVDIPGKVKLKRSDIKRPDKPIDIKVKATLDVDNISVHKDPIQIKTESTPVVVEQKNNPSRKIGVTISNSVRETRDNQASKQREEERYWFNSANSEYIKKYNELTALQRKRGKLVNPEDEVELNRVIEDIKELETELGNLFKMQREAGSEPTKTTSVNNARKKYLKAKYRADEDLKIGLRNRQTTLSDNLSNALNKYGTAESSQKAGKEATEIQLALQTQQKLVSEIQKTTFGTTEWANAVKIAEDNWVGVAALIKSIEQEQNKLQKTASNIANKFAGFGVDAKKGADNEFVQKLKQVQEEAIKIASENPATEGYSDKIKALQEQAIEIEAEYKIWKNGYTKFERDAKSIALKSEKAKLTTKENPIEGLDFDSLDNALEKLKTFAPQTEEYKVQLEEVKRIWTEINAKIQEAGKSQNNPKIKAINDINNAKSVNENLIRSIERKNGTNNTFYGELIKKRSLYDSLFASVNGSTDPNQSAKEQALTQFDSSKTKDIKTLADVLALIKQEYYSATEAANDFSSNISKNNSYNRAASEVAKLTTMLRDYLSLNKKIQGSELEKPFRDLLEALESPDAPSQISKLKKQYAELRNEASKLGLETTTLLDKFEKLFGQHLDTMITMATLHKMQDALRQIYQNVVEIDTALTELRKVSSLAGKTLEDYMDRATESAQKLGVSISEYINSTADQKRLGYSDEDAENMATYSTLLKNVGDGIDDVNTSSSYLISTLQGFGLLAKDAEDVVNKIDAVANTQPVTAEAIGEILTRSSAAMSAANNTLDETIALGTAAYGVLQNAETVGKVYADVAQ